MDWHHMILMAGPLAAPLPAVAQEPPPLAFVFEEVVDLGPDRDAGLGPMGKRIHIGLLGGKVTGPKLSGRVVPGGADWQLVRNDGCTEIVADYFIETDDGVLIHVLNQGLACDPDKDRPLYLRANPRFDAPNGKYGWLNQSAFTSTIDLMPATDGKRRIRIRFFRID